MKRRLIKLSIILSIVVLLLCSIIFIKKLDTKSDIKNSLTLTLECFINTDFSDNFHYIDMYGNIKEEMPIKEIPQLVEKNLQYDIDRISVSSDNESAIVDVTFRSIDMIKLLSTIGNESDYRTIIVDNIENNNFDLNERQLQVVMIKINDIWFLYETTELDDVLTGGLYSLNCLSQDSYFQKFNYGK